MKNFSELCEKTEAQLISILKSDDNGKKVYKFLHLSRKGTQIDIKKKPKIGAYQQYKNAKKKTAK
jgi:hypothetical protein